MTSIKEKENHLRLNNNALCISREIQLRILYQLEKNFMYKLKFIFINSTM